MLNLTAAHRRALRARAHALKPVVWIGSRGLSESVLHEVDQGLKSHELVKVKVSDSEWETRNELLEKICQQLEAAPVQHIGKILVLYRPQTERQRPALRSSAKPGHAKRQETRTSGLAGPDKHKELLEPMGRSPAPEEVPACLPVCRNFE